MAFFRSTLLAAALLPMTLAACGGDDGESQPTPEGEHYHYVTNKAFVPTTNMQAREYGLDLNKDGTVDNQLGSVASGAVRFSLGWASTADEVEYALGAVAQLHGIHSFA